MSIYRLVNRLGSGGFVVEAVLTLADIPFELELIASTPGTPLPESIRSDNPWRQVPILFTPKGEVLTECAAILFYLADKHPCVRGGASLKIENMAHYFRWTSFLASNIYEGVLRCSYPERYASDPLLPPQQLNEAVRRAAAVRVHAAFGVIENELATRRTLCGHALSPADIFLAMLYAWHGPRDDLPCCTSLTERVANDARIAPIWFSNFDHRLDHKWQAP